MNKKTNFNIERNTMRELTSVESITVGGGRTTTWTSMPVPKPPKPTTQPTSAPCLPQPSEETYPGCHIN